MTIGRSRFFSPILLAAFLGCSTGAVFVADGASPRYAAAQNIDEGYFYSNLAPHGQWFFQADLGWAWHPGRVHAGWRPYTEGQWVWANGVGWTWASVEPWGWATYHYGRWYFDPIYGWSWIPGQTWAPAWVSWRIEAGYIGWAPLWPVYFDRHPEYRWDRWQVDADWDRRHRGRDWNRWVFTRDRDFTSERVGRRAITDHRERDRIFSRSRDVSRHDDARPGHTGGGIDRRRIEAATGRPVRSVTVVEADRPVERDDLREDRMRVFRPQVKKDEARTPDRLGLAKEPTRQARESSTIQREKRRLDSIPEKDRSRDKEVRVPSVREGESRTGGRAVGGQPDPRAKSTQPARPAEPSRPTRPAQARPKPSSGRSESPQAQPEPGHVQPKKAQPRMVQPSQTRPQPEQPRSAQPKPAQSKKAQPPQAQPQPTPGQSKAQRPRAQPQPGPGQSKAQSPHTQSKPAEPRHPQAPHAQPRQGHPDKAKKSKAAAEEATSPETTPPGHDKR